jgi:ADP-ribose pyrophosphatase
MIIHGIDKITNEKWLNLFAVRYENRGHQGRWIFASRRDKAFAGNLCDAVLIVPVLRNPDEPPRLVLIREFRVPVGSHVIGLPAGLIDPGETIETTIRREMREETGLEVTAIHRVTQPLLSSSGLTDEAAAMAFVDVQGSIANRPPLEASEDIEVLLLDHAAVCRLCDDQSLLVDAKAWNVLYLYQQLGRIA